MSLEPVPGPLIVCSVLEREADAAVRRARAAPGACALVELRADHLRPAEIAWAVREARRPVVVAIRRREDGGEFRGSEEERGAGLLAALAAGARFVDVEWDRIPADLRRRGQDAGRIVLSHHGGPCRPEVLRPLLRAMAATGPGPLKLVPRADAVDEILVLRDLLGEAGGRGRPVAAFALGRYGSASRLLGPLWGSWATYGSATGGGATAPGQLPAAEMLDPYDVLHVSSATRLYGLIGSRVARSPSPAMHAAGYRSRGLDARYLALESDAIEPAWRLVQPGGLALGAFGVTLPFKESCAIRCRPGEPLVAECTAVNTVRREGGRWVGYNTDGPAALDRIRRRIDPRGARVALLGAGGTARAIAATLRRAGAEVSIFNRTPRRARDAAARLGVRAAPLESFASFEWDVLVNATPRDDRFLDPSLLRGRVVLDAVYATGPTGLVRDARRRGLQVIDGHELLAAQGVGQFELMTGVAVDFATLHAASRRWSSDPPA